MTKPQFSLLIVLFVATSFVANSQTRVAFALGINQFSFKQEIHSNNAPVKGKIHTPSLHFLVNSHLTPNFSLLYGLGIVLKGAQVNIDDLNSNNARLAGDSLPYARFYESSFSRVNLRYLELPLSMYWTIGRFSIHGGGYAAIFLGGENKYDLQGNNFNFKGNRYRVIPDIGIEDITASSVREPGNTDLLVKPMEYGYQLGFSVRMYKGLTLFGQFSRALTNHFPDHKNQNVKYPSLDKEYNQGFSLRLAYFFGKYDDQKQ